MRTKTFTQVVATTLSLSWIVCAATNWTSLDMMQAQLRLMDRRPEDCPPWYDGVRCRA